MKPRFTILTLLGVTALVAVAARGVADPATPWSTVLLYAWLLVMVVLGVEASASRPPRSTFAAGTLLGTLTYIGLVVISVDDQSLIDREHFVLPHHFVHLVFDLRTTEAVWAEWDDVGLAWHRAALAITSLAFGLLGGTLALWRHHRLERREQQEKATP